MIASGMANVGKHVTRGKRGKACNLIMSGKRRKTCNQWKMRDKI